jgi:hypothetical protein
VPGRPGARPGRSRRDREVHDAVRAQPARDVNGQVPQQPGQPGQVKARPLADGFLTDLKDAVRDRRSFNPRTGLPGRGAADGEPVTW